MPAMIGGVCTGQFSVSSEEFQERLHRRDVHACNWWVGVYQADGEGNVDFSSKEQYELT